MAKELIGDKIFTSATKILHDRDLYTDKYVKQLQFECDAIDLYQARFPEEYKQIQNFITENKGKS